MKYVVRDWLILSAVAIILALGLLLACRGGGAGEEIKPSFSGTYVCAKGTGWEEFYGFERGDYFELKKDGTLYIGFSKPGEPGRVGEYKFDGDEIMITTEFLGSTIAWKGKIKGNTIVLENYSEWVLVTPDLEGDWIIVETAVKAFAGEMGYFPTYGRGSIDEIGNPPTPLDASGSVIDLSLLAEDRVRAGLVWRGLPKCVSQYNHPDGTGSYTWYVNYWGKVQFVLH